MIRERMLSVCYDPSTIRRALPISAKDTTKTRKDYLTRERYNSNELDERKIPSYENRNGFDGNHTSETIKELKIKNGELESELDKERNRIEDLTIQYNNAISYITQLRGDLKAVRDAARILIITKDNFPPDYGRVFSSHLQSNIKMQRFWTLV